MLDRNSSHLILTLKHATGVASITKDTYENRSKATDAPLTRWSALISLGMRPMDIMYPLIRYPAVGTMSDILWHSCPKRITSISSWDIRQISIEGHVTKSLTSALQQSRGPDREGKTDNCHRLEITKEMWQLNATWDPQLHRKTEKWH